jgi:urate oxidase
VPTHAGVVLGHNQYGKAETHVVRVTRGADGWHELTDLTVSVALAGDLAATHLTGDNADVLTTDAMKNTVFAFATEDAVRTPEAFGLRLARHFVDATPAISRARVNVSEQPWFRLDHQGTPHPHAFRSEGAYRRTAIVTYDGTHVWVVSGVADLVVLKTTDSEFSGFLVEEHTTLAPTTDRVLATELTAQWWHGDPEGVDWSASHQAAVAALLETFAGHHSLSLQQTLYAMGEAVVRTAPTIAEVRLSLPNRHHFPVDLAPFGRENDNEVFFAADRPYGLIEGTVRRDGAPDPGPAFDPGLGW